MARASPSNTTLPLSTVQSYPLRTADRVKVQAAEFTAKTFDELFEKTKAIDWSAYLPEHASFPVTGKSVKSVLASVRV